MFYCVWNHLPTSIKKKIRAPFTILKSDFISRLVGWQGAKGRVTSYSSVETSFLPSKNLRYTRAMHRAEAVFGRSNSYRVWKPTTTTTTTIPTQYIFTLHKSRNSIRNSIENLNVIRAESYGILRRKTNKIKNIRTLWNLYVPCCVFFFFLFGVNGVGTRIR